MVNLRREMILSSTSSTSHSVSLPASSPGLLFQPFLSGSSCWSVKGYYLSSLPPPLFFSVSSSVSPTHISPLFYCQLTFLLLQELVSWPTLDTFTETEREGKRGRLRNSGSFKVTLIERTWGMQKIKMQASNAFHDKSGMKRSDQSTNHGLHVLICLVNCF